MTGENLERLRMAVRIIKDNLLSGGSDVKLPADSFIENAARSVLLLTQALPDEPTAEQSAAYDRALEAHARKMHPGVPLTSSVKSSELQGPGPCINYPCALERGQSGPCSSS